MNELLMMVGNNLPRPVLDAGIPYRGGYYAGADIVVNGERFLVIVAPKSSGEGELIMSNNMRIEPPELARSKNNGRQNTEAIIALGNQSDFPAAHFCTNLVIDGYDDWHLPSIDELEICYRYLKPTTSQNTTNISTVYNATTGKNPSSYPAGSGYTTTNPLLTTATNFINNGGDHFVGVISNSYYHGSTCLVGDSTFSKFENYITAFINGKQDINSYASVRFVRAVRWEKRT